MPYRVMPDGTIEADTPEQALALSKLITAKSTRASGRQPPKPANGAIGWEGFFPTLDERQQTLVRLIASHSEVSFPMIRQAIDLRSNNQVSGLMTSLKRKAKGAEIDPKTLFRRTKSGYRRESLIARALKEE